MPYFIYSRLIVGEAYPHHEERLRQVVDTNFVRICRGIIQHSSDSRKNIHSRDSFVGSYYKLSARGDYFYIYFFSILLISPVLLLTESMGVASGYSVANTPTDIDTKANINNTFLLIIQSPELISNCKTIKYFSMNNQMHDIFLKNSCFNIILESTSTSKLPI